MADVSFEMILNTATQLPFVKISRENFLKKELSRYASPSAVEIAIAHSPATAKIPIEAIHTIAKHCINFETNKVSTLSFAAGIPGGLAMLGTVPADLAQFTAHQLRIAQKLAYLYGWNELFGENGMDDGTQAIMTLFFGVMFGVNGAANAVNAIAKQAAAAAVKKLPQKTLTKGAIYPIVKQIAKILGQRMTKDIFAKGVGKVIPVIGGFISGGLTYAMFKPMAYRLQTHLQTLPLATRPYDEYAYQGADTIIN
jgi:hypothetical protein